MFVLDLMSRTPIYEQLIEQTEKLILAGVLRAHDKLPSVRSLSVQLSVNPNTIQRAYNDLCAKGVIYSVAGKGCFVSPDVDKVRNRTIDEIYSGFRETVVNLISAGVSKEEVFEYIEKVYKEEKL